MTDRTIDLDQHRGMAAQKATELRRLLSNVEALSPSVRASGEETFDMVVPAMKVRGFNFTEVTTF